MADLGQRFEDEANAAHWNELADAARSRFAHLFWNESIGCLFDVVSDDSRDASIRPNQILVVSLHHSVLPIEKAKGVVATIERELLTPYGLRSLAPSDHQYRGRYQGDPLSRDSAYHQGTVWPWLIGPFLTAYLKVNERSAKARKQAEQWLNELRTFLLDEGVGQIPEIFDGDAPHRAGGCLAQAWSVAELLRVVVEDLGTGELARPTDALATVA
jgi:glycogen debranching enzyme